MASLWRTRSTQAAAALCIGLITASAAAEEAPRRLYVQTTLGFGLATVINPPAWCGFCGTIGFVGGLHVGGPVVSWLVLGVGGVGALTQDASGVGYLSTLGPFAHVWLNADRTAYARASGGLAWARNRLHPGRALGIALGYESKAAEAWTVGASLQATYLTNTFKEDCERSCGGGTGLYDQVLYTLAFAATHR